MRMWINQLPRFWQDTLIHDGWVTRGNRTPCNRPLWQQWVPPPSAFRVALAWWEIIDHKMIQLVTWEVGAVPLIGGIRYEFVK